jgi:desulfoferrodoxin (superoxide reductase-like protein)
MKKVLFALLMLFSVTTALKADPPKKIILTYTEEGNKLKIVALHPVKNVTTHYIDLIAISVDGKEVKVIKPQKQSDAQAETIEVSVPQIKKGSTVSVKARCNQYGSKTADIKI